MMSKVKSNLGQIVVVYVFCMVSWVDQFTIIIPIDRMDQYKLEFEKGSGTFSVVFTALSLKTGKYVAIKCMKKKFDSLEKVRKLK